MFAVLCVCALSCTRTKCFNDIELTAADKSWEIHIPLVETFYASPTDSLTLDGSGQAWEHQGWCHDNKMVTDGYDGSSILGKNASMGLWTTSGIGFSIRHPERISLLFNYYPNVPVMYLSSQPTTLTVNARTYTDVYLGTEDSASFTYQNYGMPIRVYYSKSSGIVRMDMHCGKSYLLK